MTKKMTTLDEFKNDWAAERNTNPAQTMYDQASLAKVIKSRVKKSGRTAMQYFWASFVLQIIVYALLGNVIARHGADIDVLVSSISGVLIYIPFTIMLMRKFKGIAKIKQTDTSDSSLYQYVLSHHAQLKSFYQFKKGYEFCLVPLSSVIGVYLVFRLYVPGDVELHPMGAAITLAMTLLSCILAIRSENKRSFEQPLAGLKEILTEFEVDDSTL